LVYLLTQILVQKYMPALQPFLIAGLRTFSAPEVCRVSVGLVGDISRAIEGKMQPYTNDIMDALVDSLKDADLDRSVKPPVLSCFGEIAIALNGAFEPYLQHSLMLLMQASAMDAPQDDDEMIDYINQLRETVLDAYTGILTGMDDGGKLNLLVTYIPAILSFLQRIANDPNKDEAVLKTASGLLGDIARTMGPQVKDQINQPFVGQLLTEASRSRELDTVDVATWAMKVVQSVIQ
jgi:importin subunit beta-1